MAILSRFRDLITRGRLPGDDEEDGDLAPGGDYAPDPSMIAPMPQDIGPGQNPNVWDDGMPPDGSSPRQRPTVRKPGIGRMILGALPGIIDSGITAAAHPNVAGGSVADVFGGMAAADAAREHKQAMMLQQQDQGSQRALRDAQARYYMQRPDLTAQAQAEKAASDLAAQKAKADALAETTRKNTNKNTIDQGNLGNAVNKTAITAAAGGLQVNGNPMANPLVAPALGTAEGPDDGSGEAPAPPIVPPVPVVSPIPQASLTPQQKANLERTTAQTTNLNARTDALDDPKIAAQEWTRDPNSASGWVHIYRDMKTGDEVKRVANVDPPNGYGDTFKTSSTVKMVPQADGTIAAVPVTTSTATGRAGGHPAAARAPIGVPPSVAPVPIPAPVAAPGTPPAPKPTVTPNGNKIVGAKPVKPEIAGELTAEGSKQMKETASVESMFDNLLKRLEPYKNDNNPLTLAEPLAKYKLGIGSPEGELGNEISNISLASIQGMMPFASKSRNYQFIQKIGEHLPNLKILGGDSPQLIYDKLLKARVNFSRFEAAVRRYEVKHATADSPAPPLNHDTAMLFYRAAGGDPKKATEMATEAGWAVPDATK